MDGKKNPLPFKTEDALGIGKQLVLETALNKTECNIALNNG